jgi:hypothetical protein
LGGGDGDGVEVVVAELAGGVAELGVVAEVGAVGVPLADGGAVGEIAFSGADGVVEPKTVAPRYAFCGRRDPARRWSRT